MTSKVKVTAKAIPSAVASQRKSSYHVYDMKTSIAILIAGVCLAACTKRASQPPVLDQERFAAVYIALMDSSQHIQSSAVDSAAHPVALRILEREGVTLDEFRRTIAYYNADTERWKEFFQFVITKLEERRNQKAG
ncbi:MAG: hypothetical protein C4326_15200 [Ignavibacteria bacterium]